MSGTESSGPTKKLQNDGVQPFSITCVSPGTLVLLHLPEIVIVHRLPGVCNRLTVTTPMSRPTVGPLVHAVRRQQRIARTRKYRVVRNPGRQDEKERRHGSQPPLRNTAPRCRRNQFSRLMARGGPAGASNGRLLTSIRSPIASRTKCGIASIYGYAVWRENQGPSDCARRSAPVNFIQ